MQGRIQNSADPELVLGFSELARALGWVAIIAATLRRARSRGTYPSWRILNRVPHLGVFATSGR